MKQLLDTVWQRRGTSWVWDEEARNQVCAASEVWSLRQFLQATGHWPDEQWQQHTRRCRAGRRPGSADARGRRDMAERWGQGCDPVVSVLLRR